MKKPTGTFQCLACGENWDGSDLHLDPALTAVRWTCGNLFCGGSVVRVAQKSAGQQTAVSKKAN